jgi:hypothetical protein
MTELLVKSNFEMIKIEMMLGEDCSVTLPAGITMQESRQNSKMKK